MRATSRIAKRLLDVVASAVALVVLAPVWLTVMLAIFAVDGAPVLYRQARIGRGGKPFFVLKFRTMRKGADREARLTTTQDSRITRTGHFLRRSNLDELPQLWNVFRGDMSIVGPRPEVPEFVDLGDPRWQKALSVRPGLTYPGTLLFRRQGDLLAKHGDFVAYYREALLPVKLGHAGRYVDEATFWGDVAIIFATLVDILRPGTHSTGIDAEKARRR